MNPNLRIWTPTLPTDGYQAPISEFDKSVRAFADETQALGGAAVGLGAQAAAAILPEFARPTLEGVRQWGLDAYNRNMAESQAGIQAPNVGRLEDVKLGEEGGAGRLADWATYQGVKGIGNLALFAAGGGLGGAVAKGLVKRSVKDLAKMEAAKAAAWAAPGLAGRELVKGEAKKEVAEAVATGQTVGVLGAAGAMEGGSSFGEQVSQGVKPEEAVGPALAVGGINAALEFVPFYAAAKHLGMGNAAREGMRKAIADTPELAAKAKTIAARVKAGAARTAKGLAVGATAEGVTEGIQELVQIAGERWGKDQPMFVGLSSEDVSRIVNAGAVGMLVGGGAGAVIGPHGGALAEKTPPPSVSPTAQTPPGTPSGTPSVSPGTPNQQIPPTSSGTPPIPPEVPNPEGDVLTGPVTPTSPDSGLAPIPEPVFPVPDLGQDLAPAGPTPSPIPSSGLPPTPAVPQAPLVETANVESEQGRREGQREGQEPNTDPNTSGVSPSFPAAPLGQLEEIQNGQEVQGQGQAASAVVESPPIRAATITPSAEAFLASGIIPPTVTPELEQIAKENGIDIGLQHPAAVVGALRTKQAAAEGDRNNGIHFVKLPPNADGVSTVGRILEDNGMADLVVQSNINGKLALTSRNILFGQNPTTTVKEDFKGRRLVQADLAHGHGLVVELVDEPGMPWYTTGKGTGGEYIPKTAEIKNEKGESRYVKGRDLQVWTGAIPDQFIELAKNRWKAPNALKNKIPGTADGSVLQREGAKVDEELPADQGGEGVRQVGQREGLVSQPLAAGSPIPPEDAIDELPDFLRNLQDRGVLSQTEKPVPRSAAQVRAELEAEFPKGQIAKMERLGLLEIKEGSATPGISGDFDPSTNKVTLYAGEMPAGSSAAVAGHEGQHQTLGVLLGNKFGARAEEVRKLALAGDPIAQEASSRTLRPAWVAFAKALGEPLGPVSTAKGEAFKKETERLKKVKEKVPKPVGKAAETAFDFVQSEELLAYYTQAAFAKGKPNGAFRKIVNDLKAGWAVSPVGKTFGSPKLSDGLAVALAKRATSHAISLREEATRLAQKSNLSAKAQEGRALTTPPLVGPQTPEGGKESGPDQTGSALHQVLESRAREEEQGSPVGFTMREAPPPKNTVKVYKAFRLVDGKLYPMFVGANDPLPQGEWLDATEGGYHFTAPNGTVRVPADTGESIRMADLPAEVQTELRKRGIKTKWFTSVAYRPGWHGGELPFFPQSGKAARNKKGELVLPVGEDYLYPNVHLENTVIAEVELDADKDYKKEYEETAVRVTGKKNRGKIISALSGLRQIPQGGFYEYATNPLFKDRPELGKWYISGSMRIGKVLSREEADAKLKEMGVPRQPWADEFAGLLESRLSDLPLGSVVLDETKPLRLQNQKVKAKLGQVDWRMAGADVPDQMLRDAGIVAKTGPGGLMIVDGEARQMAEVRGKQRVELVQDRPGVENMIRAMMLESRVGILESRIESGPLWQSPLANAIDSVKQDKAEPKQWLAMLKKMGGVKQEEINDLGFEDWLAAQEGVVRKEDLKRFVEQNGVKLEEVLKEELQPSIELAERRAAIVKRMDELLISFQDSGYFLRDVRRGKTGLADLPEEYQNQYREFEQLSWERDDINAQEQNQEDPRKYSAYQVPGGKSYRELLITIPSGFKTLTEAEQFEYGALDRKFVEGTLTPEEQSKYDDFDARIEKKGLGPYHSGHWNEPNILVHLRFNEREVNGEKMLFVEEVQSDLHQEGKKKGYIATDTKKLEAAKEIMRLRNEQQQFEPGSAEWDRFDEAVLPYARIASGLGEIPNAPLKQTPTWAMLGFKRAVRWAAENGFARVGWTSGQTQAERYNLSSYIENLDYIKHPDGYEISFNPIAGNRVELPRTRYSVEELPGVVGIEVAQRIIRGEGVPYRDRPGVVLEGLALESGGEGMKGFYDKILPNEVKKWGKKWGVTPERIEIEEEASWSIPVPDQMKVDVLKGQMLYSRLGDAIDWDSIWTAPEFNAAFDVNRPGLLNQAQYKYVNMFADLEKKAGGVFAAVNTAVSKAGSAIRNVKQYDMDPIKGDIIKLIRERQKTDPTFGMKQVNDAILAKHIIEDGVNQYLALKNSDRYMVKLLNGLLKAQKNYKGTEPAFSTLIRQIRLDAKKKRDNIRSGLAENGAQLLNAQGLPRAASDREIQEAMKKLVDDTYKVNVGKGEGPLRYSGLNEIAQLYVGWESIKNHAAGLATPEHSDPRLRTDFGLNYYQGERNAHDLYAVLKGDATFEHIADRLSTFAHGTLDVLRSGGLLGQHDINAMKSRYKYYLPLYREKYVMNDEVARMLGRKGVGKMKTRAGTETFSEVYSPIANLFAQRDAAITAAQQNLARQALAKDVQDRPNEWSGWFSVVDKSGVKQAKRSVFGFVQSMAGSPDPLDIPFFVDGQKYLIKAEQSNERARILSVALQHLNSVDVGPVVSMMRKANGWIRWVNITANVAFAAVNAPRDVFTGQLNLRGTKLKDHAGEVLKEWGPVAKALFQVYGRDKFDPADPYHQLVREWESAGGRMSFVESLKPNVGESEGFEGSVRKRTGEFSIGGLKNPIRIKGAGVVVEKVRDGLEKLEMLNIMLENVTRLSTYKVATQTLGLDKTEAALLSKDVTTNFDRKGFHADVLGAWFLFYNAGIQGSTQVLRNLRGPQQKTLWKAMGGLMTIAFLNDLLGAAMSDDDDDDGRKNWDDTPGWKKDRFLRLPFSIGGEYVTVPLPWVFNSVWRAGEMAGEISRGVMPVGDFAPSIAELVINTFNPLGGTPIPKEGEDFSWQLLSPTVFDPVMQIIEGKDAFGKPLVPRQYPGDARPDSQVSFSTMPEQYKWLAEKVNALTGGSVAEAGAVDLNPSTYRVVAKTLTGGLGIFGAQLLAVPKEVANGKLEVDEIPILRSFLFTPKDTTTATTFHDRVAKAHGARRAEKEFSIGPNRDLRELQTVREERGGELRMYEYALDTERQIKAIRKQMRVAEVKGDEDRLEVLQDRITKAMQRFNTSWERRVGTR